MFLKRSGCHKRFVVQGGVFFRVEHFSKEEVVFTGWLIQKMFFGDFLMGVFLMLFSFFFLNEERFGRMRVVDF